MSPSTEQAGDRPAGAPAQPAPRAAGAAAPAVPEPAVLVPGIPDPAVVEPAVLVPGIPEPVMPVPGAAARAGPARRERPRNGFATAALVLGAAGMTLVTVVPGILLGVLGLRRATALRAGRLRSWLGIGLCVLWAAAGSYLLPHLLLAADPGCTAYKGPALTAYNNAISDFSGDHTTRSVAADVSRAIGAMRTAAARSRDPATTHALSVLTADLRAILGRIHTGSLITDRSMRALNRDAARADDACGTLHV